MSENEKLFTDGEAYERRMGRWSRMLGEALPRMARYSGRAIAGSTSAAATTPLLRF